MLERKNFLSLNFVKKEDYTGSYDGLRFMLSQVTQEDEKCLRVYMWPEPYGFDATPEEQKEMKLFSFDEKGLEEAIVWLNEKYMEIKKQPK